MADQNLIIGAEVDAASFEEVKQRVKILTDILEKTAKEHPVRVKLDFLQSTETIEALRRNLLLLETQLKGGAGFLRQERGLSPSESKAEREANIRERWTAIQRQIKDEALLRKSEERKQFEVRRGEASEAAYDLNLARKKSSQLGVLKETLKLGGGVGQYPSEMETENANKAKWFREALQKRLSSKPDAPRALTSWTDEELAGFGATQESFSKKKREHALQHEAEALGFASKHVKSFGETVKQSVDLMGVGAFRRGFGTLATSTLKNAGMSDPFASFLGGGIGAIGSALALPIAWAVGNALLSVREKGIELRDYSRENEAISAAAGEHIRRNGTIDTDSMSPWNLKTGALNAMFSELYDHTGTRMSQGGIAKLMRSYQVVGGTTGNVQQAGQAVFAAAMLEVSGAGDPMKFLSAAKRATTGTREERTAAIRELGEIPAIRSALVSDATKNLPKNAGSERAAEWAVDEKLKIMQGFVGAYDPNELIRKQQSDLLENPLFQGIKKQQQGWTPWSPAYGWSSLISTQSTTLSAPLLKYAEAMRRIEELRTRFSDDTLIRPEPGFYGNLTRDRWNPHPGVKLRDAQNYVEMQAVKEGATVPDVVRLRNLEKILQGPADNPWMAKYQESQAFVPREYQWTSITGLAEQMQQMQSQAPALDAQRQTADNTQLAVNELRTINQNLMAIRSSPPGNMRNTWGTDASENDVRLNA